MVRIASFITCLILLSTNIYADNGTKIYCPQCKRHLYTYYGEIKTTNLDIEKIKSAERIKKFNKNDRLLCPIDKSPINGWEYWFYEKDRPAPQMVYPALTILTKKDGKFIWYPDDITQFEDF